MNFADVTREVARLNVMVERVSDDDIIFETEDNLARMFHVSQREWWGHSKNARQESITMKGGKAKVAEWCMYQAVEPE